MSAPDAVRDLNNVLQGPPNLTPHLRSTHEQTGPNNQATHHITYTFRGVVIGTGSATSIGQAKRAAATQALQFFHANGIPE